MDDHQFCAGEGALLELLEKPAPALAILLGALANPKHFQPPRLVALQFGTLLGRACQSLSTRRRDPLEPLHAAALEGRPQAEIYDFAAASGRNYGEAIRRPTEPI